MAPVRTTLTLALALTVLVSVPAAAAGSVGSECETFYVSSVPIVNPQLVDVAQVQLCDEDDDGTFDTVNFQTDDVYTRGGVSVTDETKQRADHQDRRTRTSALLAPSLPTNPRIGASVTLDDEGNDGQVDAINTRATAQTTLTTAGYDVDLLDRNDDRVPEGYGFTVCGPTIGCQAPQPDVDVPNRVDLPDTVVYVEPIGHLP